VADKHRLESQLDGQRAKVQTLLAGARKSSAQRLTSLLLLRAHQALGPALRRWQAASLERAPELLAESNSSGVIVTLDTASAMGGGMGQTTSDARQSRIIALQRELLDREAQLGQSHQAALKWREERSVLREEVAEARADAQTARGMLAEAVLKATQEVEAEKNAMLEKQAEELRALKKRLAAAEKGWKETASALANTEATLEQSHAEAEGYRKERNEARREIKSAQVATEELEDAYRSEREAAAQRISDLEARLAAQAEQAVVARRDRPITVQRDLDRAQKEVEKLTAQLSEERKRMALMQKRVLDAEGRMEGLQKEVAQHRNSNQSKLARALMGSPQSGGGGGGGGGGCGGGHGWRPESSTSGGGGGFLSPRGERLIGGGGFGPQSPRGPGGFGAAPSNSAVQSARVRAAPSAPPQQPARQPKSAPPRHPGPSTAPSSSRPGPGQTQGPRAMGAATKSAPAPVAAVAPVAAPAQQQQQQQGVAPATMPAPSALALQVEPAPGPGPAPYAVPAAWSECQGE
jgi:chemotaxis protein histidine kinase CheA